MVQYGWGIILDLLMGDEEENRKAEERRNALRNFRNILAEMDSARGIDLEQFLAAQNRENGSRKPRKRKVSAYNKRYSKAFKKLAPKYKKKNGSWKKDGFKKCSAAARKEAKK